jgi:hypothetical protein
MSSYATLRIERYFEVVGESVENGQKMGKRNVIPNLFAFNALGLNTMCRLPSEMTGGRLPSYASGYGA